MIKTNGFFCFDDVFSCISITSLYKFDFSSYLVLSVQLLQTPTYTSGRYQYNVENVAYCPDGEAEVGGAAHGVRCMVPRVGPGFHGRSVWPLLVNLYLSHFAISRPSR